jgi:hypothetical protein
MEKGNREITELSTPTTNPGHRQTDKTRAKIGATLRGRRKSKAHKQAISRGLFRYNARLREDGQRHPNAN